MNTRYFKVGGHVFKLEFQNNLLHMESYKPFECESCNDLLFQLTIGDFKPLSILQQIGDFDEGNAHIIINKTAEGYLFYISVPGSNNYCLLQTNNSFTCGNLQLNGNDNELFFGLNNTIMMMYAFASAKYYTLLLHASVIENDGKGYLFLGKSGTGKSTHSRLWLNHITGSTLLNDDNPVIRIKNGTAMVYGSPWSGKTPCYINRSTIVGAIVRLKQKPDNAIVRNTPSQAFAAVMPSCSSARWDEFIINNMNNTLTLIAETVPVYTLGCLPNKDAAELSFKSVTDAQC